MSQSSTRRIVLSVEQALSMSYATQRFVQLGWRVIRVEATPRAGHRAKGNPNRYIGRPVAGEDRHSYYVAPNVGKEAIALVLKSAQGRSLLHRLVRELPVDLFCTNTLPKRHAALGFDYETLSAVHPPLIWCSISALGLAYPNVPGYDPMMQALCGYMDITGHPDGPPLQNGPPLSDLKAGDEAFAQVLLALLERTETGRGKSIDVSMAHGAISWLQTFLPMLDMDSAPSELTRSGNEHRQFIPVNAYPTRDGWIFVAVGSDVQWRRFVSEPLFSVLDEPRYATNESRRAHRVDLHAAIGARTATITARQAAEALAHASVPHAPISRIEDVMALDFVAPSLLRTTAPDGRVVRLPPPAVPTPFLEASEGRLPFAPAYGEHTAAVLAEAGLTDAELEDCFAAGVVA